MKTNKEYPATHSMSTAWYIVDEEGNVGIFDIDQNGPQPAALDKVPLRTLDYAGMTDALESVKWKSCQ